MRPDQMPRQPNDTARDDGGQAFPVVAENGLGHVSDGMSLRDYFAAKAMQGMCASVLYQGQPESRVARDAYDVADAMLAARLPPNNQIQRAP